MTRQPGARARAKSRTRQKILDAARRRFAERGYAAASIRDIAAQAGVSTGAVFASFAGKSDLLGEIIQADHDARHEIMERVLNQESEAAGANIDAVLAAMFEAAYRFGLQDLPLVQVTISASWSRDLGPGVRDRMAKRPVRDLIANALEAAIARGELNAKTDSSLLSRLLWDAYLGGFAGAIEEAWSLERLVRRMDRQIGIVLASARTLGSDGAVRPAAT